MKRFIAVVFVLPALLILATATSALAQSPSDVQLMVVANDLYASGQYSEATDYYEHWLSACERLLLARGIAAPETLIAIKADLAAHPPHPTKAKANPVAVDPARKNS